MHSLVLQGQFGVARWISLPKATEASSSARVFKNADLASVFSNTCPSENRTTAETDNADTNSVLLHSDSAKALPRLTPGETYDSVLIVDQRKSESISAFVHLRTPSYNPMTPLLDRAEVRSCRYISILVSSWSSCHQHSSLQ